MLDLDAFKHYNDTHGHLVGDQALRTVGRLLLGSTRRADVVARFGGEEFVILLPETLKAAGAVVAEKIRAAVAQHPLPGRESQPGGRLDGHRRGGRLPRGRRQRARGGGRRRPGPLPRQAAGGQPGGGGAGGGVNAEIGMSAGRAHCLVAGWRLGSHSKSSTLQRIKPGDMPFPLPPDVYAHLRP